jgi:hypothetical protein
VQRVKFCVRASGDELPSDGRSLKSPSKESIQARIDRARQYGKKPTAERPQLSTPRPSPLSDTNRGALASRDPELAVSSFQTAAASPAQSDPPARDAPVAQPSLQVTAAAAAAVAPQEEEDFLLQQVDDFGAAWAEKQQQQFIAAQAQLSRTSEAGGAQGSGQGAGFRASEQSADDAAGSSLTDLVLERLSRRNTRAAEAAAVDGAAPSENPGIDVRAQGGDLGSAGQAAGFLQGIATGPTVSGAKPAEEREGELPAGRLNPKSVPHLPRRCVPVTVGASLRQSPTPCVRSKTEMLERILRLSGGPAGWRAYDI